MIEVGSITKILDAHSKPFWEGLAERKLRIQHCKTCEQFTFYPRALCSHCHSTSLEWVDASGRGSIYSYTVVRRPLQIYKDEAPYVVALVDLVEGVRMLLRVEDMTPETAGAGAEVVITFVDVQGETFPRARPATQDLESPA